MMRRVWVLLLLPALLLLASCGAPPSQAETPAPQPPAQAEMPPAPDLSDVPEAVLEETRLADLLAQHPDLAFLHAEDTLTGRTLRADLDGDGAEEVLTVTQTPLDLPDENTNLPVRVTLTVGEGASAAACAFDETWNDGVAVSLQDLDETDGRMEILVLVHSTDVSFEARLYRYDGADVAEAAAFSGYVDRMLTDRRGGLWYNSGTAYGTAPDLPWTCLDLRAPPAGAGG